MARQPTNHLQFASKYFHFSSQSLIQELQKPPQFATNCDLKMNTGTTKRLIRRCRSHGSHTRWGLKTLQYQSLARSELRGHVCALEVEPEQDLQLRDQKGLWDGLRHLLLVHAPAQLHGDRPVFECNRCCFNNKDLHRHTRENHLHEPDWGQWFMNVPKVTESQKSMYVTFGRVSVWAVDDKWLSTNSIF